MQVAEEVGIHKHIGREEACGIAIATVNDLQFCGDGSGVDLLLLLNLGSCFKNSLKVLVALCHCSIVYLDK